MNTMPVKDELKAPSTSAQTKWRVTKAEMDVEWRIRPIHWVFRSSGTTTHWRKGLTDGYFKYLYVISYFFRKHFRITLQAHGLFVPSVSASLTSGRSYMPRIQGPGRSTVLPTLNVTPTTAGVPSHSAVEDEDYIPCSNWDWALEGYFYTRDEETGETYTTAIFSGSWNCFQKANGRDIIVEEYV